ncbi:hypothetical protein OEZ85_000042 [Tetradesmus obliquus]|uniref:Capsid protein n=1 Tax=Tetradesmus obliquus TaxID=3088 RepID=A0ABY8UNY5_TETOB|nr:hypothetical protein OEZ85_000042 [Tetradesmus obliquus]
MAEGKKKQQKKKVSKKGSTVAKASSKGKGSLATAVAQRTTISLGPTGNRGQAAIVAAHGGPNIVSMMPMPNLPQPSGAYFNMPPPLTSHKETSTTEHLKTGATAAAPVVPPLPRLRVKREPKPEPRAPMDHEPARPMSARYAGAGNAPAFAKYSGQGNPWQRPHGENGAIRQEPLVDPPIEAVFPRAPFNIADPPLEAGPFVFNAAANKAFVAEGGTPAMCNIQFQDITCYVDAIDVQDGGLLYEATAKMMTKEPLELPFDRYVLTMGGPVGGSHDVLSMQVAANSVDYIAGFAVCPAGVNSATSTAENATTKRSNYLSRGFGGGKLSGSQMTINNACYPTYRATATEAMVQTADAFGVLRGDDQCEKWINSLDSYQAEGFIHVIPLQFPNAEPELRLKSGINTLGNSAGITWETDITGTTGYQKVLLVKCTSVLRIAPYKQCEVIA